MYKMISIEPSLLFWNTIICNLLLYLIIATCVRPSVGGTCWETIDDTTHLCRKAFRLNITHEECCRIPGLGSVSWTPHDSISNIFYWNFLSEGANMCQRCHRDCSSVVCEPGKACRMVKGQPVCICKSRCDKSLKSRGALCGTDGRKYRNYCALQRYNCVEEQQIFVEYYGKCRNSCKQVQCEPGKHCLQDQNGVPHCIRCHEHCNRILPDKPTDYMCGENGKTYRNICELKADICMTGRGIHISHSGKCLGNETCETLTCPEGSSCLVSAVSGKPVCINCAARCLHTLKVPICGTDRQTYTSYCHMRLSGCNSGTFVSAHRKGHCKRQEKRSQLLRVELDRTNGFVIHEKRKGNHTRKRNRKHWKRNKGHKHTNIEDNLA